MQMLPSSRISALALMVLTTLVTGCATKSPTDIPALSASTSGVHVVKGKGGLFGFDFLTPYRIDIQQGNFVSKEMVAQLRPGMTKEQVRFVLGTPLLTDMFHSDRWDYEFYLIKRNGEVVSSQVSVFFKDNLLDKFDGGNNLPTESEYLSMIAGSHKDPLPETSDSPLSLPKK